MTKRLIALFICLAMVICMFPASAMAAPPSMGTRYGSHLGWGYAVISTNREGGYDVEKANSNNDYSSHVRVSYTNNGTTSTWTKDSYVRNILSRNSNATINIECDPGYYISYVVMCCDIYNGNPYACQTAAGDNAFAIALADSIPTSVTLNVSDLYAKANHNAMASTYYLMVYLEKNDETVYVGYDGGTAGNTVITADPVDPDSFNGAWVDGHPTLEYNQEENSYANHSLLRVSAEAEAQANAVGYSFAGWHLEYYRNYTSSDNDFENFLEVGGSNLSADTDISLYTHAKLTAIWQPMGTAHISKTWSDNNDQDGIRPESLTVYLVGTCDHGSTTTRDVVLTAANNWQLTVNVPMYDMEGHALSYELVEQPLDGYTANVNHSEIDGEMYFELANTHIPLTTSVSVLKRWVDDDNRDGVRPDAVKVQLYANGVAVSEPVTLTEDTFWRHTWSELPLNAGGQNIVYTVEELDVSDDYESSVETDAHTGVLTIVNTHNPAKTQIGVNKVWDDNNDQDGIRPDSVTVELYADGESTGMTAQLSEANGWRYTFTDLLSVSMGTDIVYTVVETNVPAGYTASVTGDRTNGFTVTNTHAVATTSVSVSKVWDDANNQDGIRPTSVTVTLFADGVAAGTMVLSASNNWSGEFTNLMVNSNGQKIAYTVEETAISGYTASYSGSSETGYVITNTHSPAVTGMSVSKVWDDANNQDGKRPGSVTVHLLANGEHTEQSVTLSAANNWTASWSNLSAYHNGRLINYTVYEEPVAGYTTSYARDAQDANHVIITNAYTPEQTAVTVQKVWIDNNNQDGIRPDSIQVELYADGTATGNIATLTAAGNWNHTFNNLPKNADGQPINYTVQEITQVNGYSTTVKVDQETGTIAIQNIHAVEKIDVPVNKVWNDNNNQDGIRPDSITVELYADGEPTGRTLTLDAANNWEGAFTAVDKYSYGTEVVYTVVETNVPAGYVASYSGTTITNTHAVATTAISVSKVWDDANNQDGIRPTSVTVTLLANGSAVGTMVLDASNNWRGEFTDLMVNSNGQAIVYTVEEAAVTGYTASYSGSAEAGFVVTNTHTPAVTGMSVSKVWSDDDDQDGKRPDSVTVHLLANGEHTEQSVTLNAANNWTASWGNLPAYHNGRQINYTVYEEAVEDYATSYARDPQNANHVIITNSYTPELTSLTVQKVWVDNNNQDGIRPNSIQVELYANGAATGNIVTLNATGNWNHTFANLDKYADGQPINYTVKELDVPDGYDSSVVTDAHTGIVEIRNTHEVEKTEISVNKVWNDNNDQDGIRPDSITVELYADGEPTGKTLTLDAANNWQATFTAVDKFSYGTEVVYTVVETNVPAGYSASVTGDMTNGFTVTNTHAVATTSVSVSKVWDDANNQDGIRPTSVTVTLFADGVAAGTMVLDASNNWRGEFTDLMVNSNGQAIVYTVEEAAVTGYTASYSGSAETGFVITNTHSPAVTGMSVSKVWDDANNQDGKRPASVTVHLLSNGAHTGTTVTLSAANNWTASWSNLPAYHNGRLINYTVYEEQVAGYTASYDRDAQDANHVIITNAYTPEQTAVTVQKIWIDNNNQDGIRPDSIQVELYADGAATGNIATLNATGNWNHTFNNLPKNADGQLIVYTVQEVGAVNGYTTRVEVDNHTGIIEIYNTHEVEKIDVPVNKVWNDNNNQDGIRPASITVELYADGVATGKTLTLDAANNWQATFTAVGKFSYGTEVVYTVVETNVPAGYVASYSGTTITNTHVPETIHISAQKVWVDANNQDGLRPATVAINLLANGNVVATLEASLANLGHVVFENMPKYQDGQLIVYTVEEASVPNGYTVSYTGTVEQGFTITNTHEVYKTQVSVSKVWDDANNQDGKRPDSVTVHLLANGEHTGATLILSAANNWTASWTDLNAYHNGTKIIYTVDEETVAGYTDNYARDAQDATHIIITNSYTPEQTSLTVEKIWIDQNNQDGIRPQSIQVELFANGVTTGKVVTLNADTHWIHTFSQLPKYQNGQAVSYTVKEVSTPAGYVSEVVVDAHSGLVEIRNTHQVEKIDIPVKKIWNDGNNQDGLREADVVIELYANGVATGKLLILNAERDWTGSFYGVDKNYAGTAIAYSVVEVEVPTGYAVSYSGNVTSGFVVTNTHVPMTTDLTISKVWDDNNNQDGIRPASITVNIYGNGALVDTITITAADNWTRTISGLPMFAAGQLITYTVEEVAVPGYTGSYNGHIITNTHSPATTEVSVSKVWDDSNNHDGKRPGTITVHLLANGEHTGMQQVLSEANDWNYTWTELPMYQHGSLINYTVYEEHVDGYVVTYERDANDDNHVIITNSYTPERTTLTVQKIWQDNDNQDNIRPESIQVELLLNGRPTGVIATLSAENHWRHTFTGLIRFEKGQEITYTAREIETEALAGYVSTSGFDFATHLFLITNTYNPETTAYHVEKVWVDNDNADGIRPTEITVELFANGIATGKTLVLQAEDGWKGVFENLPLMENGVAIVYTAQEVNVPEGYTVSYNGHIIINTHTQKTVDIPVNKIWVDGNNQDGIRPASVTVALLANGIDTGLTLELTAEGNWSGSFSGMPVMEDGEMIAYTLQEVSIPEGYTVSYDGYTITNTHVPATITIQVNKVWDDAYSTLGARPDTITVQLLANGVDTGMTLVLSREGKWSGQWTDLPAMENGVAITYSVVEEAMENYEATYTREGNVITITNTHVDLNNPPEDPDGPAQTGDSIHMYFMLMILSMTGVLVLCLTGNKKRKTH